MNKKHWVMLLGALTLIGLQRHSVAQEMPTRNEDAETPVNLDQAKVTLPYAELRRLWEAAQVHSEEEEDNKTKYPAGALLSSVYVADVSSGQVELSAEYRVESFVGAYEKIKLVGASMGLAQVEPQEVILVVEGKDLFLVAKEPGVKTIRVKYAPIPLRMAATTPHVANDPWLKLELAPSAVVSLKVKGVPDGHTVKLGDQILKLTNDETVEVPVAGMGGEVALWMTTLPMEMKTLAPPKPSHWDIQNEVLVDEQAGEMQYHVLSQLSARDGSALEAKLLLPPQGRRLEVKGEDLAEFRSLRRDDGQRELQLRWHTRDVMERQVRIHYVMSQLSMSDQWELQAPLIEGNKQVKSIFVFPHRAGVEFTGDGVQGPILARNLPSWITQEKPSGEYHIISGAERVEVEKKLLPRMETSVAVATKAEFHSRMVSDGSLLTEGSIELEHEEPSKLQLSLPEKAILLKCGINGKSVRPVERAKGVMELDLENQNIGNAVITKVSISYSESKDRLDAVEGRVMLELPLTPLFMNELVWNVVLPETYQVVAQGYMEKITGINSHAIGVTKKLLRNERPAMELFYRRAGIN